MPRAAEENNGTDPLDPTMGAAQSQATAELSFSCRSRRACFQEQPQPAGSTAKQSGPPLLSFLKQMAALLFSFSLEGNVIGVFFFTLMMLIKIRDTVCDKKDKTGQEPWET